MKGLTISKIEEVYDETLSEYEKGDGYRLTFSDNQTYSILIANDQNCCESFGYLASEDDLSDFVGAEIDSIGVTDTELSSEFLKQIYHESDSDDLLEIADCVFLTIHTTKGAFQIAAYNRHNGYYGHSVVIKHNKSVVHSETI